MFFLIHKLLASFFTGLAIKIIDDLLDKELDISQGKITWCQKAGQGCFVYATLSLGLAASLNTALSITLFSSAYLIGMIREPRAKQTLNIPAWLEILAVSIICIYVFGWLELFASLTIIGSIDLLDDLLDDFNDSTKFKKLQKTIGMIVLLLIAMLVDFTRTISAYCVLPLIVYLLEGRWNQCLPRTH